MRYSFVLGLALLSSNSLLASSSSKSGFLINTKLSFQSGERKVETTKEFILPEDSKAWVTLTDSNKGVVLLGRKGNSDKKSIQMEYILIDSERKPNGVISTPSIRALLGEEAKIAIGDNDSKGESISISLMARATDYKQQ